eukprot:TRINITY_DN15185_c0_g2_i1.p1 TRINITY_DN15185_c0_g2~~TRINITY_DN15185_c0_g2_i1.p1  ORF type:complete len:212 (+),score=9.52 TRINITY_DN15185_c0_g2_i1:74-709(+)
MSLAAIATFAFTLANFAFIPSIFVLARNRRHFEFFIAILQFSSAFLYDASKSFDITLFLPSEHWHELNNIITTTYGCLLAIHMMANENKTVNTLLSYLAFALVWIAQLKDDYWMVKTQYTVFVASFFASLPFLKHLFRRTLPPYDWSKLLWGIFYGLSAGTCLVAGFQYEDSRHWHTVARFLFGPSLVFLWSTVKRTKNKFGLPTSHDQWV